ncbi:hypothetical protein Goarm_013860 [Gossypium armourianum]|uniref:Uncharacterized protein n=1 Tax=Gossypium armourianum TaxID=34283 RepID=A0A7J9J493_9ROSI|nr:hypothetical protein [Gossypium armourianum]
MQDDEFVNKLIVKFNTSNMPISFVGSYLHVLKVYRKSLLSDIPSCRQQKKRHWHLRPHYEDGDDIIRSTMELNEAGIRFKKSKTISLKDITFHGGVLKLLVIIKDAATKSKLLNLVAFERLHVRAGTEITSCIFFMANIIHNKKVVALLHSKGIIQNALGSDKAVANMFNSLSKDITLDPNNSLGEVSKMVNKYCKKPWNEWHANLIHTYFTNPWVILSLISVIFLFALIIAQNIYSIWFVYNS